MKLLSLFLLITLCGCNNKTSAGETGANQNTPLAYTLPAPKTDGNTSVEKALQNRRSQRNFQEKPLSKEQLSQLLWAACGITEPNRKLRTTPSAGATYPLEIYAVIGNVRGIEAGLYRYIPHGHRIERVIAADIRNALNQATIGQRMVNAAPLTIVYTAVFERTTGRYGARGEKYVWIEAGHSAQNVYLQAEALNLGTCAIGAFTDEKVSAVLRLPPDEKPLYLMPVGYFD